MFQIVFCFVAMFAGECVLSPVNSTKSDLRFRKLWPVLRCRGQPWPGFVPGCVTSVEFCLILAEVCPMLDNFGPILVKLGSDLGNLGPDSAQIGPILAKSCDFVRHLPDLSMIFPSFEQLWRCVPSGCPIRLSGTAQTVRCDADALDETFESRPGEQ